MADPCRRERADLSKATKLKDIAFKCFGDPEWIGRILRTLTPNHTNLQQITINAPYVLHNPNYYMRMSPAYCLGDMVLKAWLEVDRVFAQLWELHPIRLKVLYGGTPSVERNKARDFIGSLLPGSTARGILELAATVLER